MARRLIVTGATAGANGGRVFSVAQMFGIPTLTDITLGFAWAGPPPHHFYEVGDVGDLNEVFTVVMGVAAPVGSAFVGGGTYWVPCSTNPPGFGVWPNGSTKIELTTTNRQLSGRRTGTMKISGAGNRVYRATDLLIWIPTAAMAPGGVGVPNLVVWDVDF